MQDKDAGIFELMLVKRALNLEFCHRKKPNYSINQQHIKRTAIYSQRILNLKEICISLISCYFIMQYSAV